jgi:WD40 repeat protein
MHVWTPKTVLHSAGIILLATVFGYASIGGLISRLLSKNASFHLLYLLPGPIIGLLVGVLIVVQRTRYRIGKGKRIVDRPLPGGPRPSALQPLLPDSADPRITTHPTCAFLIHLPPRRIDRLTGQHGPVTAVGLSGNGQLALSASKRDGGSLVSLSDVQTGGEIRVLKSFGRATSAVAFSPDARLIVAGGRHPRTGRRRSAAPVYGGIYVWDAESGELLREIKFLGECSSLAFLPDGRSIVAGCEDYLRVWDLDDLRPVVLLPVAEGLMDLGDIRAVAVSADGRHALLGCFNSKDNLRLIDLAIARVVRRYTGHGTRFQGWDRRRLICDRTVASVAISPDGSRVLSGSHDHTVRVWDLRTGDPLVCFDGHHHSSGWWRGVVGVAWLDDERAVSASQNGLVCAWDTKTGGEIERHLHGTGVACMAASGDGRVVVTGGRDVVVRVWRFE